MLSHRSSSGAASCSSRARASGVARGPVAAHAAAHAQSMGQRVGSMLSAAALSALLLVGAPGISPPAAIAAETEVAKRAVDEYIAMGSKLTLKQLDEFRGRYKLRRAPDGRVQLKSMRGDWWSVRLDMEVPGALLLRDPSGNVYAVQTETVQQIDLSDDLVCLLMFADGAWEGQMAAIEFAGDDGKVKQLTLNDKEFREVIGILNEANEDMEEGGGRQ